MKNIAAITIGALIISACGGGGGSSRETSSGESKTQHTLTVNALPVEGGNAYGGGIYSDGDVASVSFAESPGYQFSHWDSDGDQPTLSFGQYLVSVTQDSNLIANFVSVTPSPDPDDELKLPPKGETITILAADSYWLAITESKEFGDNGDALWRTEDKGENWEIIIEEKPSALAISPGTEKLAVALLDEAILLSADSGDNWSTNTSIPSSSQFSSAAFSLNEESLYVSISGTGNPGLYKLSVHENWETPHHLFSEADVDDPSHSWVNSVATSKLSENTLYITSWYAGDIWKSNDGGETFQSVREGLKTSSGIFAEGVCTKASGGIEKIILWQNFSTNGGAEWQEDNISPRETVGCPQHRGF